MSEEIKYFRQAVQKLDEIKVDLENLIDKYSDAKEIVEAVNNTQIKATDLLDRFENINNGIVDDFKQMSTKKLDLLQTNLSEKLLSSSSELNSSIELFNKATKTINLKTFVALVISGIFIGSMLFAFLAVNVFKEKYFQDEINAKDEYSKKTKELDQIYKHASSVEKNFRGNVFYLEKFNNSDKYKDILVLKNVKESGKMKSGNVWVVFNEHL